MNTPGFQPPGMRASHFYLGVDLGQSQSHTALAMLQRAEMEYRDRRDPVNYDFARETLYFLRYAERLPLGTPYPAVADYVRDLVKREPVKGQVQVVVDGTGVGVPVVDLLKQKGGLGCPLTAITITGGESPGMGGLQGNGTYRVPKRDLISGLKVAFEEGSLQITEGLGPGLAALVEELGSMRAKRNDVTGYVRMKGTKKDDLVLALSLACWKARKERGWVPSG